ncbi:hypothetical protein OE88DRAFT_1531670 [Heliocybe sulcata]|uniref:Uncharacterized protein n=1 Tax=Heliocybe sulcata TaxID=5364 RepID=A0A5C3N263_9AGAM|nr:hypothetical protein OE88DRAFT_1531670 [Heliocybe sulcata]
MHVMTLRYEVDDRIFRYTMYVHNKTFMELIRRTDEEWLGKGRLLWWTDWGRENARMVVCHMDFHWLRYVHGTRVVCPPERVTESRVPGQGVLQRIKVLDFNLRPYLPRPSYLQDEEASPTSTPPVQPAPVSWPVVDGEEASLSPSRENDRNNSTVNGDVVETSLVLEPSQIVCEAVFKEPVETTLPYRMVSRVTRVPQGTHGSWWGFSGFMMDEERLIGLKSTALSEGDMCEIMVYTL